MYNILMIRSEYKLAGPGILVLEYAKELQKRGHKVITCSSGGEMIGEFAENGIQHIKIDSLAINRRGFRDILNAIKEIKEVIKSEDINIIHGQNATATMLSYIASKLLFKRDIKIVNTVLGKGKEWFLKILPTQIIAVSDDVKKRLLGYGIKENKIITLYNGIIDLKKFDVDGYDRYNFRNELNIREDEYLVGTVAKATGQKGHKEIIESANQLLKKNTKVKFVLVGNGAKLDEYKAEVRNRNLSNNIIFTGDRRDIPNIMAGLDILAHMPESETFGMVLIEAMAMGKPVIAKEVGGIPEVVARNETGYLVADSTELTEKILELINDESKRNEMGKNGVRRVEEMFTIEKTINNLISIYENL